MICIDDILIFSISIDQHFKHLQIFLDLVIKNGLVLSKSKIKLFQIKTIFLGYEFIQGIIKPI